MITPKQLVRIQHIYKLELFWKSCLYQQSENVRLWNKQSQEFLVLTNNKVLHHKANKVDEPLCLN